MNPGHVEPQMGGMTCASCAARIEKRLNKLDGVTAAVNYATEQAKVTFPDTVRPEELISQVEGAGYTAALPTMSFVDEMPAGHHAGDTDDPSSLRTRVLISLALTL